MTDNLKPRGVVDPTKKPNFLEEVRLDAARNTVEHFKRQEEQREFEAAKARGLKVTDVISNAKKDLGLEEEAFEGRDDEKTLEAKAEAVQENGPSLNDLRARAKELGLPADGNKEALKTRIADAEKEVE